MSNLKQVGIALKLYLNDFDHYYPDYDLGGNPGATGWFRYLDKYHDNRDFMECPSAKMKEFTKVGLSYGYNYPGLGDYLAHVVIRENDVKKPARTIAVADSDEDQIWDSLVKVFEWFPAGMYQVGTRHFGGPNIQFADGSVSWHRKDPIMAMPWNEPLCRGGSTPAPNRESWWDVW
jgi:prepilin-type processing-associated H-X9-DG protein